MFKCIVTIVCLISHTACTAAESEEDNEIRDNRAGQVCGVYATASCLNALGYRKDVSELLSAQYIGATSGSSADELLLAIEHAGAKGMAIRSIDQADLRASNIPVLLFLRNSGSTSSYNHWVAFLGFDGREFKIIDNGSEEKWGAAELLIRWRGEGVLVANSKGAIDEFLRRAQFRYLMEACAFLSICLLGYAIKQSYSQVIRPINDSLVVSGLFISSIVLGISWHSVLPEGFFRNDFVTAALKANYFSAPVQQISGDELSAIMKRGGIVLIDARLDRDFKNGSIADAVSIPVDSTLNLRKRRLESIDRSSIVVVFCTSSQCVWSDEIAKFMIFNKFKNVAVYRGGYTDWIHRQESSATE